MEDRSTAFRKSSLNSSLRQVDDFDPAVFGSIGHAGILEALLSITNCNQPVRRNLEDVDQILANRRCTPLGKVLVEGIAADGIGMAVQHNPIGRQCLAGQRLAEFLDIGKGICPDLGGVEVEIDLDVDASVCPSARKEH